MDPQHSTESSIARMDAKTRSNLAYIWSISIIVMIGYIIVIFGEFKEILTLIIGFITGVGSTILALYFGGMINKPNTAPKAGTAEVNFTATANTTDSPEKTEP